MLYSIELTSLEFLIYNHLQQILTVLIISLLSLIILYLTKSIIHKGLKWSITQLNEFYRYTYAYVKKSAPIIWKNITTITKDVFNLKDALPKREAILQSLDIANQKIRKKEFKYKTVAIVLSNILVIFFLIRGLTAESNSIKIPNPSYLEIKFLIYKIFVLISHKLFPVWQIVLEHLTLQNVLLSISATSAIYILSIKRFRDRIKKRVIETSKITYGIVLEKSEMLQNKAKDIANKKTWPQIKKEAKLLKEELKEELYKEGTGKKIVVILIASLIALILISGSLNHEDNLWTSFVAATAGQMCDGNTADERCDDEESCCDHLSCYATGHAGAFCHNATPGEGVNYHEIPNVQYDYDANESSCIAFGLWCGPPDTTKTSCKSLGIVTKTGLPWGWGLNDSVMGNELNTGSCCGDDANEYFLNCSDNWVIDMGSAGYINFSSTCSNTTDLGCCSAVSDCVDPGITTLLSMGITTYCYATGDAYNVSGSELNDSFSYCSNHAWYDCDTSSTYCVGGADSGCDDAANWPLQGTSGEENSWVKAGEGAVGEYNSTDAKELQCCGDDENEYYGYRNCNSGCSTDSNDDACCSASDKCVYSSTCYANAACYDSTADYYCNSGGWENPDGDQSYCNACETSPTGGWYTTVSGGSGGPCCGDDSTSDDFYQILEGGSPHVCMYCNDGGNNSAECYQNQGCDLNGQLLLLDTDTSCAVNTSCYCYFEEACASTGYTPPSSMELPGNCTSGGFNDDSNADCFVDGTGVNNGTCHYSASDPCIDSGLSYSNSTACADEGNTSAEEDEYGPFYCYCDEGCTTSGANSTCSLGTRRPDCNVGTMSGVAATNCEEWNVNGSGTDICHYSSNAYGDVACHTYDGGTEGCWDFENGTTIYGAVCEDCESDYQADFGSDKCYFAIVCTDGAGWTGSQEDCFEWCWGGDLTTANCFGSQTNINRTEPANDSTCYYTRSCVNSAEGCGWTPATMDQDFCDQCEPGGVTQGDTYCPPINASCLADCEHSGEIWYGNNGDSINRCSNLNTSCMLGKDTLTYGDIWGGNDSAAWCDTMECTKDCRSIGEIGGYCDVDSICICSRIECDNGCLYIRNSTNDNLTIFTYTGDLFITGWFATTVSYSPPEDAPSPGDFAINYSADYTARAYVDDVSGNMTIINTIFQNQDSYCTELTKGYAFEIKDNSGQCVAFINDTGDVWLRGNLTQYAELNP